MEQNVAVLKQAIADKEAPLRVAHTRLYKCTRRPNIELCRDSAQLRYAHSAVYCMYIVSWTGERREAPHKRRLVHKVHGIYEGVERLQAKLRESEAALQHLLNTKLALEAERARKSASLFLDRDKCIGTARRVPTLRAPLSVSNVRTQ